MRIMGLDFGAKTVGVAISDPLLITAQGIEIIRRKEENKLRRTLARIEELIEVYQIGEIVLGLPKHMNDTEGTRVELTKEFAEKLERRTGLPVHLWDERLTNTVRNMWIRLLQHLFCRDILICSREKHRKRFRFGKNSIYSGRRRHCLVLCPGADHDRRQALSSGNRGRRGRL